MSLLTEAKKKAGNFKIKEAFKNEEGAIDLASIMVGIIVIGLIGGVIAATVFAVIPWAQDNAAKQQLDSVASAESAYIGLSTQGGSDSIYGGAPVTITIVNGKSSYSYTRSAVVGNDSTVSQKLFDGGTGKIAVGDWGSGGTGGAHYGAAAKSASGKTFYISDSKTQPTDNAATAATNELGAVVNSVVNL